MNERYRDAAEHLENGLGCRICELYAAKVLRKLATGEWVLCEKRESMRDSYNGGESYTYYAPIPELP